MNPEILKRNLCAFFCQFVEVHPTPSGWVISSPFQDSSGDPISVYLSSNPDGFVLEDDGAYLASLLAKDIRIDQGSRAVILDAILAQANASWDRDTLELRTGPFDESELSSRVIAFLAALIRARDLELLTRDAVRSTFREDAAAALSARFGDVAIVHHDAPVAAGFEDFPADMVISPGQNSPASARPGAIFFVTTSDKLNEALLLRLEATQQGRFDFEVIALIEDLDLKTISKRKFQRAQNRSVTMPIFRGDEARAVDHIANTLGLRTDRRVNMNTTGWA
jgi:hypothetical protein